MKSASDFLDWLNGPTGGGSTKRPWHVLKYAQRLDNSDGAIFWRIMTEEWSCFDLIPHADFEAQFTRFSATAPGSSIIDNIKLFRGQDADAPVGLSWTSSADVAASFSRGHRGIFNKKPVILQALAHPHEVAFDCDDREESEFVLLSRPASFQVAGAR